MPVGPVNNDTPSSLIARRFTSANRTCSITCWLSEPPGSCSMLITLSFEELAVRDLAGAQHDLVARHAAGQMMASSLTPT